MPYNVPAGLAAFSGGLSAGPGNNPFGSVAGAVGQTTQPDESYNKVLQVLQLEQSLNSARERRRQARLADKEREQAKMAALAQQGQREELRGQLNPNLQELFDVDPETAIAQQFPATQTPDQAAGRQLQTDRLAFDRRKFEAEQAEGPAPTPLERNLLAGGLQPGTPEYQQAALDTILQTRQGENAADKAQSAVTVQQAKTAAKAQEGYNRFNVALQQHRANLQKYGGNVFGEGATRVRTSLTALRAAVKEAKKLGTYDEGVARLLEEMVSDPSTVSKGIFQDGLSMIGLAQSAKAEGLTQLEELEEAARADMQAQQALAQQPGPERLLSDQQLLEMYMGAQ